MITRKAKWMLAAGCTIGLLTGWRKFKRGTFRDQIVVVTGGSRGLGFALASELINEGARVLLLARNEDELAVAREKLGPRALTYQCDVTQASELRDAIQFANRMFGRVDTFIHNAGFISVGPLGALTDEDFKYSMDLHFGAALTAVRELKPIMKNQGGGRIVFVSSIGGKVGVPHLAAYSASKFAQNGFADAIRAELALDKISLTVADPGLMRTGSPGLATFKGDAESEFLWFAASDHLPLVSISADRAARKILNAALDRRSEILVGWPAKVATLARALLPELTASALSLASVFLPKSENPLARLGDQARDRFDQSKALRLLQKEEQIARNQWNQPETIFLD